MPDKKYEYEMRTWMQINVSSLLLLTQDKKKHTILIGKQTLSTICGPLVYF